jgi:RNA polymerase sigma factor (sigma-70 family)
MDDGKGNGYDAAMEQEFLARRFEEHRAHLRAVAYRMLGSLSEADDAVQEAWLRLSRSDTSAVNNLVGWLTTVVGRVCLDMLRSRASRAEQPLDVRVPDPIVSSEDGVDPEHEALLADSVGLALLVVLETLAPPERLAFVLHDLFAVPFEEIAPIVGRTPTAARQLASRARRRVQGSAAAEEPDQPRQREIVNAFMAASRGGDFDALLALLDPDVTLRADTGVLTPGVEGGLAPSRVIVGAREVASQAFAFRRFAHFARPVLVNGLSGIATMVDGRPVSVLSVAVRHGKIVEIDILADQQRLSRLDLTFLKD